MADSLEDGYVLARGEADSALKRLLRSRGAKEAPAEIKPKPDAADLPDPGQAALRGEKDEKKEIIGGGPIEFGWQIAGGIRDAVVEAGQAVESMGNWLREHSETILDVDQAIGKLQIKIPEVDQPKGYATGLVRGVSQFLTGFIPGMKATKIVGIKGAISTPMIAGAIADMAVFDPDDPNLSKTINDLAPSLKNPLTEYLATDPSDGEAEKRFKRAVEGVGLGLLTDGVVHAAKLMRSARNTRKVEGAFKEATAPSSVAKATPEEIAAYAKQRGPVDLSKYEFGAPQAEAVRKMITNADTVVVGNKALKINWENLENPEAIDAVIKQLTKLNEGAIAVARRGVQSDETTKELANALGLTVEDVISRQRGQALNAEQTQAYIDLFGASVSKLQRLTVEAAENIASGKMAPEIEQQFRQQLGVTTAITEHIFGARAEAGRALRIWGTTAQKVKETAAAVKGETELLTAGRTLADVPIERLVQMMTHLERPEQVAAFSRSIARGNASVNALMEAWINGLLSNPVTHTVNALSNATVTAMGIGERALAVGGRQLANKLGLADDVAGAVKGETTAMIQGVVGGMKDALRMSWRALRSGESQLGLEKMDLPRRAISSEAFGASGNIGKGIDLLGESVRLPGRFLVAADDFFKSINYRMELHAQAWREAVKEGGTSEQMASRMAQLLSDPPSKVRAAAEGFANYQTFTNALEGGDFISEAGRSALQFSNRHPLARVVFPFIRTPTNVFKYTLERTPIANLALKQVRDDLLAGGIRRDMALSKMAMGSMILGTAAYLASEGKITGAGPANYNLRKIKEQTGWQPYSVLIGDKYYAIGRLAPIGTLFGIMANYHEIAGDLSDESAAELAMILTMSFKDAFMDLPFLTGISSIIQAMESPDKRAEAYVKQLARSVVPAGLAQMARVMDPTVREAEGIMETMRSRVPGYSKDLPPDRNLWGEPILREGGIGPDMITPFYSSTRKDDPVAEEIVRLQVPVNQVPNWIGGARPGKGVLADPKVGQGVWLNPQEYDRLRLLAAGIELKGATMPLRERLEAEMEKPFFQRQSDDGKKVVLYSIIQQYREAARMQLLQEFPELGDLAAEIQREKAESFKPTGEIRVR